MTDADELCTAEPELLEALHAIPELRRCLAAPIETVRDGPEFRLDGRHRFYVPDLELDEDIEEIRADVAVVETERSQLIRARVGQGLFRERVAQIEVSCRVSGVTDLRHLRASHIKPWRLSTNQERLDGANGLLLAPHVDHLFDRGFISFSVSGRLLASSELDPEVLRSWGIDLEKDVGRFTEQQERYLAHHRQHTFLALPSQNRVLRLAG